MANKKIVALGLQLALILEDEADHMLVQGGTGPLIANILREYAQQIRKAPDIGAKITYSLVRDEIKKLIMDLQAALGFIEARAHGGNWK